MRVLFPVALCLLAVPGGAQPMPDIGPTIIPFYTGNLSVDSFMYYWGTRREPPVPQVTPESVAQLKRISCFAICDYLAWCLIEKEKGRWDFSLYRDNADRLRTAGIKYNVFCWLHFPPKWYLNNPDFIPYRCLEHDQPVNQMSLWAPSTRRIYQTFYRQLAQAMGDRIAFLRLAMPSEYGEIGYPVGMTNWVVPQAHVHPGFWCGDPEARRAFRAFALRRYGTLAALNAAWGTVFGAEDAITFPPVSAESVALYRRPAQKASRTWWLDFQDWYNQSWTDFMVFAAGVVKRNFPGFGLPQAGKDLRERKEIIISLGYGAEVPAYGNDQGRHVAAMKRAGLSAQTPGDISYFATRRVSSACALYGVPYYTEPPGDVNRDREVQRIWMDASNGAQVYFDYPQNLDGARDLFAKYKTHLTGRRSLTDFGLLLPTTTHFLHPEWGWPPYLHGFSDVARDRLDYEVLDERMIADGGLQKLGIRMLALADAEYLRPRTLQALAAWVRRGGVLIALQTAPVLDTDGSDALWQRLAPSKLPAYGLPSKPFPDAKRIWSECGRSSGKGYVLVLPGGPSAMRAHAELVAGLHDELSAFLPGARNGRRVYPDFDGIRASVFSDRILYYNPTDRSISKDITLRAADFGGNVGRPERLSFSLDLPAHSIVSLPLR
jgi:hypothetical protein